jgi:hypothetical protein
MFLTFLVEYYVGLCHAGFIILLFFCSGYLSFRYFIRIQSLVAYIKAGMETEPS